MRELLRGPSWGGGILRGWARGERERPAVLETGLESIDGGEDEGDGEGCSLTLMRSSPSRDQT